MPADPRPLRPSAAVARSVEHARELERGRRPTWNSDSECVLEDRTIPSPGGTLALRSYRPASVPTLRAGLVFFHAGGFVVGDETSHDVFCGALCRDAQCVVVSCGYRLAPEHRFPNAVDDAYYAACWVHERADEFGIDHKRLAIGGIEAGANLAANVSRLAKDRRNPALRLQMLICPWLDLRAVHVAGEGGTRLDHELERPEPEARWQAESYARTRADLSDPRCSPLLAQNLIGLPPVWMISAARDPLRAQAEQYARRLEQARVEVHWFCPAGLEQSYEELLETSEAGRAALRQCAEALRAGL